MFCLRWLLLFQLMSIFVGGSAKNVPFSGIGKRERVSTKHQVTIFVIIFFLHVSFAVLARLGKTANSEHICVTFVAM